MAMSHFRRGGGQCRQLRCSDQRANLCTVIGQALPVVGDRAHPLIVAKVQVLRFFSNSVKPENAPFC